MILLIDNYDSFTFNLYQHLSELGADVAVHRNDKISLDDIERMLPTLERIVISPGPCTPAEAGISMDVIREFAGQVPMLGVCLGHQSIGAAFGGNVIRADELMHGSRLFERLKRGPNMGVLAAFVVATAAALLTSDAGAGEDVDEDDSDAEAS